jgi:hypothetical protein
MAGGRKRSVPVCPLYTQPNGFRLNSSEADGRITGLELSDRGTDLENAQGEASRSSANRHSARFGNGLFSEIQEYRKKEWDGRLARQWWYRKDGRDARPTLCRRKFITRTSPFAGG